MCADQLDVADPVLRHAARPAEDLDELGLRADAHDLAQLGAHDRGHLVVVQLCRGLAAGAPEEAAQQHVAVGRAPVELARAPRGRHDGPVLGARHDEPEALEVVPHLVGPEGDRRGRRRDVIDR